MAQSSDAQQRREHAHCVTLQRSPAFQWYLAQLGERIKVAQRDVCAEDNPNRNFVAGRLGAFVEATQYVDRRYEALAPLVEVVE